MDLVGGVGERGWWERGGRGVGGRGGRKEGGSGGEGKVGGERWREEGMRGREKCEGMEERIREEGERGGMREGR